MSQENLDKRRLERLRKKVWNKTSVRNPIAKELLQGDGKLGAKVIESKKALDTKPPRYGNKKVWLEELEELNENQ
jgi:hypothetical protein